MRKPVTPLQHLRYKKGGGMHPLPPEHLAGTKELHKVRQHSLTLVLLHQPMMASALALLELKQLSPPSQKIQACPMPTTLPNRLRRSWKVLALRKLGSPTKAPSRTRNGKMPRPLTVKMTSSICQEQEKKPSGRETG
jgi:hypothetical protein